MQLTPWCLLVSQTISVNYYSSPAQWWHEIKKERKKAGTRTQSRICIFGGMQSIIKNVCLEYSMVCAFLYVHSIERTIIRSTLCEFVMKTYNWCFFLRWAVHRNEEECVCVVESDRVFFLLLTCLSSLFLFQSLHPSHLWAFEALSLKVSKIKVTENLIRLWVSSQFAAASHLWLWLCYDQLIRLKGLNIFHLSKENEKEVLLGNYRYIKWRLCCTIYRNGQWVWAKWQWFYYFLLCVLVCFSNRLL